MNKKEYSTSSIILGIVLSILVVYMTFTFTPRTKKVNEYYQVYLSGEKIGLIRSKQELYDLIDQEQQEIKKFYNVPKVYPPSGLEIEKVLTYKNNVMTAKEVYNEIKDIDPFTIEGYEVSVTLDKNKKNKFYILNKEDLDIAARNTVISFLKEEEYDAYLNNTQKNSSKDDGMEITDVYFDQPITIKKAYISTEKEIITNADDLSRFFLFGKTELSNTYKVKASDTIETIAEKNKLGVPDFLIANPDIVSEKALLAEGQEVNVAPINPVADVVVDSYQTETQKIKYESKTILDKTLNATERYVKQRGSNGFSKVVYATHEVNGQIINTKLVSEDVITPAVDEIVVVGAKNVVYVGNSTYWAWPTTKPYRLSSYYGWRIHPIRHVQNFHTGLDITGTKSYDIYAIQDGVVKAASYQSAMGNYLRIEHPNGYVAVYEHLKKKLVKVGEEVEKGQKIAIMGCTGSCTGTHLHLTIYHNGTMMNPLNLYR